MPGLGKGRCGGTGEGRGRGWNAGDARGRGLRAEAVEARHRAFKAGELLGKSSSEGKRGTPKAGVGVGVGGKSRLSSGSGFRVRQCDVRHKGLLGRGTRG